MCRDCDVTDMEIRYFLASVFIWNVETALVTLGWFNDDRVQSMAKYVHGLHWQVSKFFFQINRKITGDIFFWLGQLDRLFSTRTLIWQLSIADNPVLQLRSY